MTKIKCDKCGSLNVEEFVKGDLPKEQVMTMEEYANRPRYTLTPAIYYITTYMLICKKCGHIREYSR